MQPNIPKTNPWRVVAILLLIAGCLAFGVQQCRVDDRDKQLLVKDTLIADQRARRLTAEAKYATCQKEQADARRIGAGVLNRINEQIAAAPAVTAKTPARQQQKQVVRYYVDNKLVPPTYLRDTVTVTSIDSSLVAAANTANLWLGIYRNQIDSLGQAYGNEKVAAEAAEQRADEEREARQDCEDENDAMRKGQQQQRKRTFWAVVRGVGAGVVGGVVAALIWLK